MFLVRIGEVVDILDLFRAAQAVGDMFQTVMYWLVTARVCSVFPSFLCFLDLGKASRR
jgi:hypothetical protein